MTEKLKRKRQPQTGPRYWWNEFLFSRSFEIETSLSPDECAVRLRHLAETPSGFLTRRSVTADVYYLPEGVNFYVCVKYHSRGAIDYTAAKAEGSLAQSDGTGLTLAHGIVKFGWFYYFYWLLVVASFAFCILGIRPFDDFMERGGIFSLWMIFSAAFIFFFFRSLFAHRDELIHSIHDALDDSAEKTKRKRA